MPNSAPKPCSVCSVLVHGGGSRCDQHAHQETGRFADRARGTRHERGYGSAWDRKRLIILARDAGICQPCKREGRIHEGTHVDHRISKAEWFFQHGHLEGVDDDSNLQTINKACHQAKTASEALSARGRGAPKL